MTIQTHPPTVAEQYVDQLVAATAEVVASLSRLNAVLDRTPDAPGRYVAVADAWSAFGADWIDQLAEGPPGPGPTSSGWPGSHCRSRIVRL